MLNALGDFAEGLESEGETYPMARLLADRLGLYMSKPASEFL
jgi:hypothetical protein